MHETLLPREFFGGRLRRLHPRDRAAFQAYRSLPELGRYQGWSLMSDAEAHAFLDEMRRAPLLTPGQWVQLGIATPESDELVGDIGLYLSEDGTSGEIGPASSCSSESASSSSRAAKPCSEVSRAQKGRMPCRETTADPSLEWTRSGKAPRLRGPLS